jgi:hypothetical protein
MTIDTVDRQRKYVESQQKKGSGLGIVFADAFLRGMRDLGYKNPAWALAEEIDNSFQASADAVTIRFGFEPSSKSHLKPDRVAVCDDGNGMIPEMISYAVRWGGTDREGDRKGFGRYGYGLPSSAVSLAKRYSVYSKTSEDDWHAVTVDIDALAGASGDLQATEKLLTARPADLPAWLSKAAKGNDSLDLARTNSGTVILFEDLDRLRSLNGWIKVETLRTKLLQHFGVIYRHWIPERKIVIDGVTVQAVDPLFLMEHARFFDETVVRAQRVETKTIQVSTRGGAKGTISIRAAVLPPDFQLANPDEYGAKGAKNNKRFDVMKDYNGILMCRERRQIDCIAPDWTKYQNYDYNVKIEVDFDPGLDEYFGISTAKQQIVVDDEMWEILKHGGKNGGGLADLISDLRRRRDDMEKILKAKIANRVDDTIPRPSVRAMEESEKFKGSVPEPTQAQQTEARENIEKLAGARAAETGKPKEQVIEELLAQTSRRRWDVEFATIPEGPFYRPLRLGEQKRLIMNTDHPFYTKIYDLTPDVRSALEVLLFVLAERELEVKNDAETFYRGERQRWSERLRRALDNLVPEETLANKAAAVAEQMYSSDETEKPPK